VSPAVATPLLEEATQQASVYQLLIIRRDTIVTDYFIGPTIDQSVGCTCMSAAITFEPDDI